MSEISVEKVQKTIDLIMKIAASFVKIVPGDTDDRVLQVLEQFAAQPWFPELVTTLINTFTPNNPVSKEAALKLFSEAMSK
jgi:hypothetical protein